MSDGGSGLREVTSSWGSEAGMRDIRKEHLDCGLEAAGAEAGG